MTSRQAKQVQEAFGHVLKSIQVLEIGGALDARKFVTSFVDRNDEPFTFYAYTRKGSRKIYLSDNGAILKEMQKSGMGIQLGLVQSLLRTYDLTFTQDGMTVDMTDRPLWQRVTALFQAWAAGDGVVRTWTRSKG
jgi:hypothetical protein